MLKHHKTTSPKSVLVLGTHPWVHYERIRQLSFILQTTDVHLLCRPDDDALTTAARAFYTSTLHGDEANPRHLEKALLVTKASLVIIPLLGGAEQTQAKDPIRLALTQVLMSGQPEFARVQVLGISNSSTAVIRYERQNKVVTKPTSRPRPAAVPTIKPTAKVIHSSVVSRASGSSTKPRAAAPPPLLPPQKPSEGLSRLFSI